MKEIKQVIYEHGGSRIWFEERGIRFLVVDSFLDEGFAKSLLEFVKQYLK